MVSCSATVKAERVNRTVRESACFSWRRESTLPQRGNSYCGGQPHHNPCTGYTYSAMVFLHPDTPSGANGYGALDCQVVMPSRCRLCALHILGSPVSRPRGPWVHTRRVGARRAPESCLLQLAVLTETSLHLPITVSIARTRAGRAPGRSIAKDDTDI